MGCDILRLFSVITLKILRILLCAGGGDSEKHQRVNVLEGGLWLDRRCHRGLCVCEWWYFKPFYRHLIVSSYRRYCNAHSAKSRFIHGIVVLHTALWSMENMHSNSEGI